MNSAHSVAAPLRSFSAAWKIDQVCRGFEQAWATLGEDGEPPAIQSFVADYTGAERDVLVRELILLDVHHRARRGNKVSATEYLRDFPNLDTAWLNQLLAAVDTNPGILTTQPPITIASPTLQGMARVPAGYELLEELGRGGMGVVYKARQTQANRIVALKMILGGEFVGESSRARFRTEIEASARLRHPNIVQIHEVGEFDGLPFFSMEYCEGGSLAHRLRANPLPPREAAGLVQAVSLAIQHAHEKQIIHRDLKPANILLSEPGALATGQAVPVANAPGSEGCIAKVSDFGLARMLDATGQTASDAVLGTPSYMAPEQAGGRVREMSAKTDVYALGAILYELLTGRPPFRAATVVETLNQVMNAEPVPPTQLQPGLPRDLETICLKCLEKEPARRYVSAQVLADDLARFLAGEPINARPVGAFERASKWVKRRPLVSALVATVILSVVGGATAAILFAAEAQRQTDEAVVQAEKAETRRQNAEESQKLAETRRLESMIKQVGTIRGPADSAERDAFWEVANLEEDRLRLRYLDLLLQQNPERADELRYRAEELSNAVAGLNSDRRRSALALIRQRLGDEKAPVQARDLACSLARVLEDADPETAALVVRTQLASFKEFEGENAYDVSKQLSPFVRHLRETDRQPLQELLRILRKEWAQRDNSEHRIDMAVSICHICAALDTDEARKLTAEVTEDALERLLRAELTTGAVLSEQFGQLVTTLKPAQVSPLAKRFFAAFKETSIANTTYSRPMMVLLDRLSPDERREQVEALLAKSCENSAALPSLNLVGTSTILVELARRGDAKSAQKQITELMKRRIDRIVQLPAERLLQAVTELMEFGAFVDAKELSRLATQLIQRLQQAASDPRLPQGRLTLFLESMANLLPLLSEADRKTTELRLSRAFVDLVTNPGILTPPPFRALPALLPHLSAEELTHVIAWLDQSPQGTSPLFFEHRMRIELALADRLPPEEAAGRLAALVKACLANLHSQHIGRFDTSLENEYRELLKRLRSPQDREVASQIAGVLASKLREKRNDATGGGVIGIGPTMPAGMQLANMLARLHVMLPKLDAKEVLRFRTMAIEKLYAELESPISLMHAPQLRQVLMKFIDDLTVQELANLLKQPTCVREARGVVMAQIEKRSGKTFASFWDCVAWLESQEPALDLSSPPARPLTRPEREPREPMIDEN